MANHPSPARQVGAAVAGAAVAALGALILGEYDFSGATPYIAGVLFGLVVAEVVMTVGRGRARALVPVAAAEAGLGLLWALWISTGRGRAPFPAAGYASIALGAVIAGAWSSTNR